MFCSSPPCEASVPEGQLLEVEIYPPSLEITLVGIWEGTRFPRPLKLTEEIFHAEVSPNDTTAGIWIARQWITDELPKKAPWLHGKSLTVEHVFGRKGTPLEAMTRYLQTGTGQSSKLVIEAMNVARIVFKVCPCEIEFGEEDTTESACPTSH
ncbi:MAG: hypothetical protein Q8P30_04770 [Candidatus Uhrbacteria bacterium]|nr:hypothetical protein [Candidatus Uhrbacteria bacterium]